MSPDETARLQDKIKIFVAEKHWEGCDGLAVTEEMQVTIAAQACLMLLGVVDFYFDNVKSVLIFPRAFSRQTNSSGIIGNSHRAGEAWQGGPIILSWKDTLKGGRNEDDGHNLVIHEFAHALDGLDGEMGGNVVFDDEDNAKRWSRVVDQEFSELCKAKEDGISTLLDHYGATNPAEFFAVASETFFEKPDELEREHNELFELLQLYYHVNPKPWQRDNRRKRRK